MNNVELAQMMVMMMRMKMNDDKMHEFGLLQVCYADNFFFFTKETHLKQNVLEFIPNACDEIGYSWQLKSKFFNLS